MVPAQPTGWPGSRVTEAHGMLQINEFTATRWQRQPYSTSPLSLYGYEGLGDGVLSQYGFPDHYKCAAVRALAGPPACRQLPDA